MSRSASCAVCSLSVLDILSNSISNSFLTGRKPEPAPTGPQSLVGASGLPSEARVVALGKGSLGKGVCERACGARGVSYGFQRETGKARGGDLAGGG